MITPRDPLLGSFCRCGDNGPLPAGSDGCGRHVTPPSRVPELMARYESICADIRRVDALVTQRSKTTEYTDPPVQQPHVKPTTGQDVLPLTRSYA